MPEETPPDRAEAVGPENAVGVGWRAGTRYFQAGLVVLGSSPWLYVRILTIFALPAVLAAILTAVKLDTSLGGSVATFGLNAISSSVAPAVIMVAVAAGFANQNLGVAGSIRTGLRWLARYLWTNAHTTVVFWAPVGALVLVFRWQREAASLDGTAQAAADGFWYLGIALVALYMHSRTLLAPFLAVHENMPGTLAALESWRLSGEYFPKVFGTFIVSSAPTAVPLGALIVGLLFVLDNGPKSVMLAMIPSLTWVAIKFIRPFLVTAVYPLQKDLWIAESRRRDEQGHPTVPSVLTPLVKLSALIPRTAGKLVGQNIQWSL
jgi:hypothetical protein